MSRLPPISEAELKRLYERLSLAKQVVPLAQTEWPTLSVREAIEKINPRSSKA
jgi:hypothetical protein